ncbi:hypothetical protein BWO90_02660 (plasmid) [Sinorhizobium meliloti]|nr:hypothetical protein BWO76_02745 [Sinorhizobium meliloti]ATB01084.1 hypothetical protein BWO90_02660 [Sinorhizobium meliloti]RVO27133.1 hypothetical protein CN095_28920 [Sinorhizobium meliloti]
MSDRLLGRWAGKGLCPRGDFVFAATADGETDGRPLCLFDVRLRVALLQAIIAAAPPLSTLAAISNLSM